ncbi:TetR family transcriptional regulator [Pseudovibrio sp. SPO723]|uniref:TetR family transcriptional regulator n=1 Tax=Nesiotobacter zosterae TaxID=392721 RepID=UPI0029C5DA2E|nr:TetR family transcriptional regulator [Pseudovibrio sp. SPO723]MDX5594777.1 TetR family transcriptional regulator [Pseudovibrio sp. SPO723]
MAEVEFKRARTAAAKAQRTKDLLAAAGELLKEEGMQAVTLKRIAEKAGVVKSNVYRYFESREDIMLQLLLADLNAMLVALEQAVTGPMSAEETAVLLARGYCGSSRTCLLLTELAPTLEHNVSQEGLRAFKRVLLEVITRASSALHKAQPHLERAQCESLIFSVNAVVAGLWPVTHPCAELEKVMAEAEFSRLKVDFEQALIANIHALLLGAEAFKDQASRN